MEELKDLRINAPKERSITKEFYMDYIYIDDYGLPILKRTIVDVGDKVTVKAIVVNKSTKSGESAVVEFKSPTELRGLTELIDIMLITE